MKINKLLTKKSDIDEKTLDDGTGAYEINNDLEVCARIPEKELAKGTRRILMLLALIAAVFFLFSAVKQCMTGNVNEASSLYNYSVTADSVYGVILKPNTIYETSVLEEGRVYPSQLLDTIQMDFTSSFFGSDPSDISGHYEVYAELKGVQDNGDAGKKLIYEKTYPITSGDISEYSSQAADIYTSVYVNPADYSPAVTIIEQELGTSTSKDFSIVFKGNYDVVTQYGDVNEPFEYSLSIPLNNELKLFEITKADTYSKDDAISDSQEKHAPVNVKKVAILIILALLMLTLFMYIKKYTRNMTKEEAFEKSVKNFLRKYSTRLAAVYDAPDLDGKNVIRVADTDSMLVIAEDRGLSIMYVRTKEGMPENMQLFVECDDTIWLYIFELDNAEKV